MGRTLPKLTKNIFLLAASCFLLSACTFCHQNGYVTVLYNEDWGTLLIDGNPVPFDKNGTLLELGGEPIDLKFVPNAERDWAIKGWYSFNTVGYRQWLGADGEISVDLHAFANTVYDMIIPSMSRSIVEGAIVDPAGTYIAYLLVPSGEGPEDVSEDDAEWFVQSLSDDDAPPVPHPNLNYFPLQWETYPHAIVDNKLLYILDGVIGLYDFNTSLPVNLSNGDFSYSGSGFTVCTELSLAIFEKNGKFWILDLDTGTWKADPIAIPKGYTASGFAAGAGKLFIVIGNASGATLRIVDLATLAGHNLSLPDPGLSFGAIYPISGTGLPSGPEDRVYSFVIRSYLVNPSGNAFWLFDPYSENFKVLDDELQCVKHVMSLAGNQDGTVYLLSSEEINVSGTTLYKLDAQTGEYIEIDEKDVSLLLAASSRGLLFQRPQTVGYWTLPQFSEISRIDPNGGNRSDIIPANLMNGDF